MERIGEKRRFASRSCWRSPTGEDMTGYCGLDCEQCGAFIATRNDDDALRAKVAEEWARQYNAPIKPEHINCTGCLSTGVKTYYASSFVRPGNAR
jgi:hypothetical protein